MARAQALCYTGSSACRNGGFGSASARACPGSQIGHQSRHVRPASRCSYSRHGNAHHPRDARCHDAMCTERVLIADLHLPPGATAGRPRGPEHRTPGHPHVHSRYQQHSPSTEALESLVYLCYCITCAARRTLGQGNRRDRPVAVRRGRFMHWKPGLRMKLEASCSGMAVTNAAHVCWQHGGAASALRLSRPRCSWVGEIVKLWTACTRAAGAVPGVSPWGTETTCSVAWFCAEDPPAVHSAWSPRNKTAAESRSSQHARLQACSFPP